MEVIRKTPKGAPSTSEAVLQELAARGHELPAVILEHRGLAKLKSTYVDKLPEMVDPDTGRVHTSYHQAVAATGRLSSSDPNLQNIPVRTEEGRRIRKAFVAEPGWKMLAADYSQIELRIMAHLSGDPGLLRAFEQGLDIHAATAAEVFGFDSPEAVDPEARRRAKAINFGLIYGMSAFGLARQPATPECVNSWRGPKNRRGRRATWKPSSVVASTCPRSTAATGSAVPPPSEPPSTPPCRVRQRISSSAP